VPASSSSSGTHSPTGSNADPAASDAAHAAGSDAGQSGSSAPLSPVRPPATHVSQRPRRPKQYTDGTVRWFLSTTTDEPVNLQAALDDPL
jgi:hypothetical protein